jgi:hypothetical protein
LKSIDLSEITCFSYNHASAYSGNVYDVLNNCDSLISVSLPKLKILDSPAYNSRGLCSDCQNLKYVYLGSPEYPITSFTGYYGSSDAYRHFYGANNLVFINLITENGLKSDVKFTNMYNTIENRIICSKAPIELYSDDNFDYMIIDNEVVINAYKGTATEIEIPSTVKNIPITKISDSVFYNSSVRTEITSVTLPSTVTSLGYNCFRNCSNLTQINLQNVTSLGQYCFYYCTKLASIDLSNITSLGDYCFQSCSNLTEVTLSDTITSLSNYCFASCAKLASINIPKITNLGDFCFNSCTSLTSIDLPNVTSLGDDCFRNCTSLTSIDLPSVTSIATRCFYSCSKLTSIYLPSVTSVAANGFEESGLEIITLPKLTRVTQQCFANARKLQTVIIGSKEYPVTYIHSDNSTGDYAITSGTGKLTPFYYCSALKKVVFVTANGSLSDITLSNGNYVGTKSSSFATANIYNITTNSIFQFIADSYSLIEDSNFKYEVSDDEATITAYKGTATEVEIPSTINGAIITKIDSSVFYNSSVKAEITSVNLPNTVTSLGDSCFENCTNLASINIPNVTSLGAYCFFGCSKLTSIESPLVTSLGRQCFSNCTKLTLIELPSATSLGYYCFSNATALKKVILGGVGKSITDTSRFSTECFTSYITHLTIYVSDPSNPPTLTGSPWGATSATITYEQA